MQNHNIIRLYGSSYSKIMTTLNRKQLYQNLNDIIVVQGARQTYKG